MGRQNDGLAKGVGLRLRRPLEIAVLHAQERSGGSYASVRVLAVATGTRGSPARATRSVGQRSTDRVLIWKKNGSGRLRVGKSEVGVGAGWGAPQ